MYKCALLGCGGRAHGHAEAYRFVRKGQLAAICDLNEERLHAFGERWGLSARYTDLDTMLERERPDLLHIVTPPQLRHSLLAVADAHRTPAVLVEKPIALQGEDYRQLCQLAEKTRTKICVNHQLHFHPRSLEFQRDIIEGRIGELRFIEVSARLNLSGQGTHALELVSAYNADATPTSVFANVSGSSGLASNHPAPDQCAAAIQYDNGVRALLLCGTNAPRVNDSYEHMQKRIAAYGTRGFRHWTMEWWERTAPDGSIERGTHRYADEDVLGQAGITDAVLEWLDDENRVHPTNLKASLRQFNIILGIYMSALSRAPISLPVEPKEGLLDALREALKNTA